MQILYIQINNKLTQRQQIMPNQALQTALLDCLSLGPNQHQQRLQQLHKQHNLDLCQAILELLYNEKLALKKQDKQKLVTGFNFIAKRCFQVEDKNGELWRIYVRRVAARAEAGIESELELWSVQKIFSKSLKLFLSSFQQQFIPIFEIIYQQLTTTHKILLYAALPELDLPQKTRTSFLQMTLPSYISMFSTLLRNLQQLHREPQQLQYISQILQTYMESIHETLKYLHYQSCDSNQEQYLINRVCAGEELFEVIRRSMFFERQTEIDDRHKKQRDQGIGKVFGVKGSYSRQEGINNLKAMGLQIFCVMLKRYSYKSTMAEFDENKVLNLMQNLTPSLIRQLSQIPAKRLNLPQTEPLTISSLHLIHQVCPFLFMNSMLYSNQSAIFWQIIYPLLTTSDQQIRQFQDDPQAFIAQSQTLVQKEEDDPEKVQSCKTWAGFLLERIVQNIDGALSRIVNQILEVLQSILCSKDSTLCDDLKKKFQVKLSLETCFTVLQVLTAKIKNREDLLEKIRFIFIDKRDEILRLNGLQKARMILYLCYNFDDIMRISKHNQPLKLHTCTIDYYEQLSQNLSQPQPLPKEVLQFYQTYSGLQKSTLIILECMLEQLQRTRNIDIIQTITRVIDDILSNSIFSNTKQADRVQKQRNVENFINLVLDKCIMRIFADNQQYIRALGNGEVFSNLFMIKCLAVVRAIARFCCKGGLGEEASQAVMAKIWAIFQLFQYIYETNYDQDLIKLFDTTLSFIPKLTNTYMYQFLTNFAQHHKKHHQLGRLFYTYLALLKKGEHFLKDSQQGKNILCQIVENCMIIIRYGCKHGTIVAIILLQYLLLNFGKVDCDHQQIFGKTRQFMEERGRESGETCAVVVNLWVIGSVVSESYDLGVLEKYDPKYMYGYHAKVFSVAINKKIQSLIQPHPSKTSSQLGTLQKVAYLLKKSLQTLICLSTQNKNKNSKTQQKIEQLNLINPFEKIRQTLVLVKNKLNEHDYEYIMGELDNVVARGDLKRLFQEGSVSRDSRVIFKFK